MGLGFGICWGSPGVGDPLGSGSRRQRGPKADSPHGQVHGADGEEGEGVDFDHDGHEGHVEDDLDEAWGEKHLGWDGGSGGPKMSFCGTGMRDAGLGSTKPQILNTGGDHNPKSQKLWL